MYEDEGSTSIIITRRTRDRLRKLKVVPRESYDDVLKRLIEGGVKNE